MIAPRLHQAFTHTRYRVVTPSGAFVLRIGRRSVALASHAHFQAGVGSALITAWNPGAHRRSLAANLAAQKKLEQRLRALRLPFWRSRAIDPKGQWPDEHGVLIAGVPERLAIELGRSLGQRAIVHVGPDAVPRLRWL